MPKFNQKQFKILNLILAFCLFFPFFRVQAASDEIEIVVNLYFENDREDLKKSFEDAHIEIWKVSDKDSMSSDDKFEAIFKHSMWSDKDLEKDFKHVLTSKEANGTGRITIKLKPGTYYARVKGIKNGIKFNDFVFSVSDFLKEKNEDKIIINPKHTQPEKPGTPPPEVPPPPETPPPLTPPPPETPPPENPPDVPPEEPKNPPPYGHFYFKKVSVDGKPIEGVVFRLTKVVDGKPQNLMQGEKIFTLVSDKNGDFDVELQFGDYELWETKQAPGFEQLTQSVKFTVDGDDSSKRLVVKNKPFTRKPLPKTGDLVFPMLCALGAILFITGFAVARKNEKTTEAN